MTTHLLKLLLFYYNADDIKCFALLSKWTHLP